MASELKIGDHAPNFRATAVGGKYGSGREVALADFRGTRLVLYFYPKDDTPGCTRQACGLRDAWAEIRTDAAIFGVSIDPPQNHEKFIRKFGLPFPLLADPQRRVVRAYGVWVQKNFLGKKYIGTERSTFVIDGNEQIAAILRKVKPDQHVDLLKQAIRQIIKKEVESQPVT